MAGPGNRAAGDVAYGREQRVRESSNLQIVEPGRPNTTVERRAAWHADITHPSG